MKPQAQNGRESVDPTMRHRNPHPMTPHRLGTALATAAVLLAFVLPGTAVADPKGPTSNQELALKIKGWHCDG